MANEKINSESKFIWSLLFHILLTPITLIQVLFKKKGIKDVFLPFTDIMKFVFEPKFTITLIILNIMIYFIGLNFSSSFFESLINYPSDLFSFRIYTLITSGFLHANLSHLLGNMLALFIFGRVVERKFGVLKTAGIYFGALLISGIFSSIANLLMNVDIGGLGASGAIMGLVSAATLVDPFYFTYELIIPMPIMVAGWLTIYSDMTGLLSRVDDGIGHFVHLGGFLSISIIMFIIGGKDKEKLKKGFWINIASLIILSALYFLFIKPRLGV